MDILIKDFLNYFWTSLEAKMGNFRELVEKLDAISNLNETVSQEKLATTFSTTASYETVLRVLNKLKFGNAESLNAEDRLEAAKLLKMLLPSISSDVVYNTIKGHETAVSKEKEAQSVSANSLDANNIVNVPTTKV